MNFSENLQKLRKEKNISQEKLAEELNVSRQTVGKWENGVSCPEAECLVEISDFFGVSIDTLLKGTVPEHNETEQESSARTEYPLEDLPAKRQRSRKIRFVAAIVLFIISPFFPGEPGANSVGGFFMVLCVAIGIGLLLYNRLTKDQAG